MSRISRDLSNMAISSKARKEETVVNFMGGESYTINPLDTLKMVSASSIFGEPSYYRDSNSSKGYIYRRSISPLSEYLTGHVVIPESYYNGKMTTNAVMEDAIDRALEYDFLGTLNWAADCRYEYYMRINPQIIMVRAAISPMRKAFTQQRPGLFDRINQVVMRRADEPLVQMAYFLYLNGGRKNNLPSILKRSWRRKLESLDRYAISKYKNSEIGMINGVRLSHAYSELLTELIKTGTVEVDEDTYTWENLRSQGYDWKTIFNTINMGHMALLRNLRGVFTEVNDLQFCRQYTDKLKEGVLKGKQFPFRYYSAANAIRDAMT